MHRYLITLPAFKSDPVFKERETVQEALQLTCGNISKAAGALGVSRPTLHDLLRRHEIDVARYRDPSRLETEGVSR